MTLQEKLYNWENLCLAYQKASRGKRGKEAVAAFDLYMADELLKLEEEISAKTYQPGCYQNFYIHEPKK